MSDSDQNIAPAQISNSFVEIDVKKLKNNIAILRQASEPARMMGIVKANAYGHGALLVAQTLVDAGIEMLAVATVTEGIELRDGNIDVPILVLASPIPRHLHVYEDYHLDVTVNSVEGARALIRYCSSCSSTIIAHIKVDTGMGRLGCAPSELPLIREILAKCPAISIGSIWTHLANSTQLSGEHTSHQVDQFNAAIAGAARKPSRGKMPPEGPQNTLHSVPQHVLSSYALITSQKSVQLNTDDGWTRIGVALFGMMDQRSFQQESPITLDLAPIMRWVSRLVQVKIVPAGTPISYGGRWISEKRTTIGTVSAGYADGYKRSLSGQAFVGIEGRRFPVVGTICMDMFMIDLGAPETINDFFVGQEVVLMGDGGPSVFELADWADTISYEIATGITSRVGRRITNA